MLLDVRKQKRVMEWGGVGWSGGGRGVKQKHHYKEIYIPEHVRMSKDILTKTWQKSSVRQI